MNGVVKQSKEPMLRYWNKGGFVLCVAGWADVLINEQNYRLTRGGVFVITPLVQIYDLRPSEDFRMVSFVNDLKVFYPIFQLISDTGIPLKVRELPCWQLGEEEIAYVIGQERNITAKQQRLAETALVDEKRILQHLINLLRHETMLEIVNNHIRRYPSPIDSANKQDVIAYRFILALHENYHRERSVAWYASQANLSAGHFAAIIKNSTGKSPSEWISTITTTYAKLMLEQNDKSIKEIAQELNFPEQFTFRKYFKQHTGLSPKEYRLMNK